MFHCILPLVAESEPLLCVLNYKRICFLISLFSGKGCSSINSFFGEAACIFLDCFPLSLSKAYHILIKKVRLAGSQQSLHQRNSNVLFLNRLSKMENSLVRPLFLLFRMLLSFHKALNGMINVDIQPYVDFYSERDRYSLGHSL